MVSERWQADEGVEAMEAMSAGFARAAAARPAERHELACTIAGRPAKLEILGDALAARLAPVFPTGSGPSEAGDAELTLQLWDERACGISRPEAALSASFAQRWDLPEETYGTSRDRRLLCLRRPHAELWLDRNARRIVGAVTAAEAIPLNLCGKPFQPLVSVWCRDRGVQLVHAGLVSQGGRGVLIAGESGAGKSTTSLACAVAGLGFLGDDCVGVERDGAGGFRGHGIYATAFLMDPDVPTLVASGACEAREGEPKQLVTLARAADVTRPASVAIEALVLPRVSGESASRLERASKREALLALTPSSMLGWRPRQDARGFERLAALTLALPVWRLEAGSDLADRARVLRELLAAGGRS